MHHREHNDNDILTPVDAKRNSELTNVSSFPTEPSSDKLKKHLFLRVPSQMLDRGQYPIVELVKRAYQDFSTSKVT